MADVSVKMGVSGIAQFKQGMSEAQASVKTLDAALKANEKQFARTGDAESHLAAQTSLLNQKLKQQQEIVKNAEAALKQMDESGVRQSSKAYQDMQRRLIEAQSDISDTQEALDNLGSKAAGAAEKTDKLGTSLGGLNKKVSLEQVISAIGTVTDGMERAAKKAVELGKAIWDNITDSAQWADNTATQAMILNMDVEEYQKYKKVFDTIGEITVAEWQRAKQKVQKVINDPTQEQIDILQALGLSTHETAQGKYGEIETAAKNFEDMFWEIGETLRKKVESGEMTQDLADTYANVLFGRGFAELNPMFTLGQEGFLAALADQNVVTEESVKKLADLNDMLIKLQGDFNDLKAETLSGLAPALQTAAQALDGMLTRLMEYLQTPEGKQALEDMGKAVEGMFKDISELDPEKITQGFADVFNSIVGGLQWLEQNSGTVIGILEAIGGTFLTLKVSEGALTMVKLLDGLKGLMSGASAADATSAGAAAGSNWASGFASAVLTKAPWLTNFMSINGAPVFDWLTHESPIAGVLNGQESIGDLWNRWMGEIQQNASTFFEDWSNNEIIKWFTRRDMNQDAAERTIFGANWSPSYMTAIGQGERPLIEVEPVTTEDAAEVIAAQVGIVDIPAQLVLTGITGGGEMGMSFNGWPTGGGGGGLPHYIREHANGIWSVPFDGYPALLHKGERVMTAREAAAGNRTYSSNLYVESMYMNNGQDAEGLASAIAAAQKRTSAGYGG